MRIRFVRPRWGDVALLAVVFCVFAGLYVMGYLRPSMLVVLVAAVVGCLVAGTRFPAASLAVSLALPLSGQVPGAAALGSRAEILGVLLNLSVLLGVVGRRLATSRRRTRTVLLAFGMMNALVLVMLPHGEAGASSLAVAVLHAVTVALALASRPFGVAMLARVCAPAGVAISYAAYLTPDILVDRTTAAAGQNANGVGLVAALCLVLAGIGAVTDRKVVRPLHVLVAGICFVGVLVSQSRGAYLDIAVATLVLLSGRLLARRSLAGWATVAVFVAAVAYVGTKVVAWAGEFTGRFQNASVAAESLETRKEAAFYSLYQGLLHPLDGVGLTNLAQYSSLHEGTAAVRSHIVYLGIWGELGIASSLLFGWLCWMALSRSRRIGRRWLAPVALVLASGVSVNWWPQSGVGALTLGVLAWGASVGAERDTEAAGRAAVDSGAARYVQRGGGNR